MDRSDREYAPRTTWRLAVVALLVPGCTLADAAHGGLIGAVIAGTFVWYLSASGRVWRQRWRWFVGAWIFVTPLGVLPVIAVTHRELDLGNQSVMGWMLESLTWGHWVMLALIVLALLLFARWRLHLDELASTAVTDKVLRDSAAQQRESESRKWFKKLHGDMDEPPPR